MVQLDPGCNINNDIDSVLFHRTSIRLGLSKYTKCMKKVCLYKMPKCSTIKKQNKKFLRVHTW